MKNELIIYHGSEHIIEKPEYRKGKPYNDYGLGFYCTEYIELAKEWACDATHGGYANKYSLDLNGLKILDLNGEDYCILHWISILLKNRKFTLDSDIASSAREYILENFPVDTTGYDVVMGYRANDSYFSYARDFLQNTISVKRLSQVMKLGNLGNQVVLVSEKAFEQLTFIACEEAPQNIYFPLRKKRDELARTAYLTDRKGSALDPSDIYVLDIIRGEMKANDPRLQ
ncbi:MAG: DUF3990 domain-containing protein [Clostridia bacterium]|nr:DUF3990 domain-containing protein [Clostridia bacterium]